MSKEAAEALNKLENLIINYNGKISKRKGHSTFVEAAEYLNDAVAEHYRDMLIYGNLCLPPGPSIWSVPQEQFDKLFNKIKVCDHSWKEYVGFTSRYDYCTKCDEKKGM